MFFRTLPQTPQVFVDLGAIAENYAFLKTQAPRTEMGAVVKANSYGLGAIPIARVLEAQGCRSFFVANFEEALALRAAGIKGDIIVLHGLPTDASESSEAFAEACAQSLIPVLNHWEALTLWADYAKAQKRKLPAMIHFDTGMSRLGFSRLEHNRLCNNPQILEPLILEAWVSHFARSDEFSCPMTTQQRQLFLDQLKPLPKARLCLCNSSGLFWGSDYQFDLARPGLALYGGNPTPDRPNPMKPVVTLQAPILQVRAVGKGDTVGYGSSYTMPEAGRLASVAIGYADGYSRHLANKGRVALGGFYAPVVGRISMDQLTIDVSGIPESVAHEGAWVTLWGAHRSLETVAAEAETISYEILTNLGPRVQRIYKAA